MRFFFWYPCVLGTLCIKSSNVWRFADLIYMFRFSSYLSNKSSCCMIWFLSILHSALQRLISSIRFSRSLFCQLDSVSTVSSDPRAFRICKWTVPWLWNCTFAASVGTFAVCEYQPKEHERTKLPFQARSQQRGSPCSCERERESEAVFTITNKKKEHLNNE